MVKNCQQFDTFFLHSSIFSCQFWFPCSNVQFCEWDIRFAKLDYKWTHCVSIVSTQKFCDDPHHHCLLQVNIWGRGLWTSKIAANQVENRPMKTYSMHVNLAANERLKDPFWNCYCEHSGWKSHKKITILQKGPKDIARFVGKNETFWG